MADYLNIAGRVRTTANDGVTIEAQEIKDLRKNKFQHDVNQETDEHLSQIDSALDTPSSGVKDRLSTLEAQVAFSGDFQAENTPQGIISGSGKIATANAVRGAIDLRTGYFLCDTAAATAAKIVAASGYVLTTGGSIKVNMTYANSADDATLNINGTGAKPLYYNGGRASATNSWDAGETVEVYYDGTNFYANNVAGGGDGVFDLTERTGASYANIQLALEALSNIFISDKKKSGITIRYIDSTTNEYTQWRYMLQYENTTAGNAHFSDVKNWEKVGADTGLYTCMTPATSAVLDVSAPGYVVRPGGSVKVKFTNAKDGVDPLAYPITIGFNSTVADPATYYPVIYNGAPLTNENTWNNNEVVEFYFDGTNFVGQKANIVIDSVPTAESDNLVKSSGVYDSISNFITASVDNLVNYYLKSETYTKSEVAALISAIKQFHYEVYASTSEITDPQSNVLYLIGPTGSGSDKYEEYVYPNSTLGFVKIGDTSIDLSGYVTTTALNTALGDYTTTANLTTLLAQKQDVISDLNTIRSGASAGATAYQKPVNGIPISDLASGVVPFDISASHLDGNNQPTAYTSFAAALGTNGANVPIAYRNGGMFVKFILQLYTLAKTTSQTEPTGTLLTTDPAIAAGTKYKASDLSVFATLPTNDPVVYYVSDGEATPTYTIYTISKNAVVTCEYVQYRYMNTDAVTNATFVNVANWQGVDDEPTAGSHNLVESGGVAKGLSYSSMSVILKMLSGGIPVNIKVKDLPILFEEDTLLTDGQIICSNVNGVEKANISKVPNDTYKSYIIPLDGVGSIDVYLYNTTVNAGSVFFDSDNLAIYGIFSSTFTYSNFKRNYITERIKTFVYNVNGNLNEEETVLILYPKNYDKRLVDKKIGFVLESDSHEGVGGDILEFGITSVGTLNFTVNDCFIDKISDINTIVSNSNATRNYYITDIEGYSKLRVSSFRTSQDYPSGLFLDKDMNIISVIINPTGHDYITDYANVPTAAKYFVYINSFTVQYYYQAIFNGIKNNIEENAENITYIENNIGVFIKDSGIVCIQGNIDSNSGQIVNSSSDVILKISGGRDFYLTINEGYDICSAHLLDKNNKLIAYNYLPPKDFYSYPIDLFIDDAGHRRFYGSCSIPVNYTLVIIINKYSQGVQIDVNSNENIIKQFCYLNDGRLSRMIHDTDNWDFAISKILQLAKIFWTAKDDIFASNPSTGVAATNYFFKKGKTRFGVPYSEASEYSKYVGQNVSLYTFLTAIHNKRSVMYTEKINSDNDGNVSQYGIVYHGLDKRYASSYYGTVCTGYTGFVAGLDNLFISGDYNNGSIPGMQVVNNANSQNVKPLDFIWNSGHCSVIMDIVYDEYNRRKYILWAEQTKPTVYITPYTTEMFEERLRIKSCVVYRYTGWANSIKEPENTPFIQKDWETYPLEPKYNDDICTMYGDKPCITVGDVLWLNYNKTKGFTNINIEKKTDNTWTVVENISLLDNSNVRELPNDDYNDINLTSKNYLDGIYRAKMSGATESDYTYWEIIDITLSYDADTHIVYFSSSHGTPYLIRQEHQSGIEYGSVHNKSLSASDVQDGQITISWPWAANTYIKVFVRGEYGTAVKRILYQQS